MSALSQATSPAGPDVHGPLAELLTTSNRALSASVDQTAEALAAAVEAHGLPTGPDLTKPRGRRAVIYARISKGEEGKVRSPDRQIADCRAYCAAKGWDVVEPPLVDINKSAFKREVKRPYWERALEMAENGEADVLVAWHSDRLSRNDEIERLIDVVEATLLTVDCVTDSGFDLKSPGGRLVARILNNLARHESEHKSKRNLVAVDDMTSQGKRAGGGRRQFGFKRGGMELEPVEANAIRWAVGQLLEGASLGEVCRHLPPPVSAKEWHRSTLRQLLIRPSLAGLVESHERGIREDGTVGRTGETELVEGDFPAILDRETWENVRAIMADPARKRTKPNRGYPLSGLAIDQHDRALTGHPRADRTRRYGVGAEKDEAGAIVRRGCAINADGLDDLVTEALLARADGMRLTFQRDQPENTAGLVERREALEAERAELQMAREADEITFAEYLAEARRLKARVEALEADEETERAKLGGRALAAELTKPGALRDAWPALAATRRAAILRAELEHVRVGPATGGAPTFKPERVSVRWADGTETTWPNGKRTDVEPMAEPEAVAKVSRVMASHLRETKPTKTKR